MFENDMVKPAGPGTRKLRKEAMLQEAEMTEKLAKLDQEKAEMLQAQEEADRQNEMLLLEDDTANDEDVEHDAEDEVARLGSNLTLGLQTMRLMKPTRIHMKATRMVI